MVASHYSAPPQAACEVSACVGHEGHMREHEDEDCCTLEMAPTPHLGPQPRRAVAACESETKNPTEGTKKYEGNKKTTARRKSAAHDKTGRPNAPRNDAQLTRFTTSLTHALHFLTKPKHKHSK